MSIWPARICIICGGHFRLQPDHKGFANRCLECNSNVSEPERFGAEVSWEGKHTPVIEVVSSLSAAQRFNRKGRRLGASILGSICQSQMTGNERESVGANSDAAPGAIYRSSLNEKHAIKR